MVSHVKCMLLKVACEHVFLQKATGLGQFNNGKIRGMNMAVRICCQSLKDLTIVDTPGDTVHAADDTALNFKLMFKENIYSI